MNGIRRLAFVVWLALLGAAVASAQMGMGMRGGPPQINGV